MIQKIYILDTSAFLSGKPLNFDDTLLIIPPAVSDEITPGGPEHTHLQLLKAKGLQTQTPTKIALHAIKKTAQRTGDYKQLSTTDIQVLALAYDLNKPKTNQVTILTDDYAIQNIAHHLQIPYQGITQNGIKHPLKWTQICPACHTTIPNNQNRCPICGTLYRRFSKRQR